MNFSDENLRYASWFNSLPPEGREAIGNAQSWREHVNSLPGAVPTQTALTIFSLLNHPNDRVECIKAWTEAQGRGDWAAWGNFCERLRAKNGSTPITTEKELNGRR